MPYSYCVLEWASFGILVSTRLRGNSEVWAREHRDIEVSPKRHSSGEKSEDQRYAALLYDHLLGECQKASLCVEPRIRSELLLVRLQRFDDATDAKLEVSLWNCSAHRDPSHVDRGCSM